MEWNIRNRNDSCFAQVYIYLDAYYPSCDAEENSEHDHVANGNQSFAMSASTRAYYTIFSSDMRNIIGQKDWKDSDIQRFINPSIISSSINILRCNIV